MKYCPPRRTLVTIMAFATVMIAEFDVQAQTSIV